MLGSFAWSLLSADFFSKLTFSKVLLGIPSVSNSLDPDKDWNFPRPELGLNCLQR